MVKDNIQIIHMISQAFHFNYSNPISEENIFSLPPADIPKQIKFVKGKDQNEDDNKEQ